MSIDLSSFVACALISCALIITVRQYKPEFALPVSIAASAVLCMILVTSSSAIIETLSDISEQADMAAMPFGTVLKVFGISIIVQLAADVCRDCGESSLAGRLEAGGRAAIVIASLPLFEQIFEIASALIDI